MHEFVAFVEGVGLTMEFLICLIITSALCKVVQQSFPIYDIIIEMIPKEIVFIKFTIITISSIVSWSISSILVITWIIYRYPNLVISPTHPITPWFGMNQTNRLFPASKSVLFITLILSTTTILKILYFFSHVCFFL